MSAPVDIGVDGIVMCAMQNNRSCPYISACEITRLRDIVKQARQVPYRPLENHLLFLLKYTLIQVNVTRNEGMVRTWPGHRIIG